MIDRASTRSPTSHHPIINPDARSLSCPSTLPQHHQDGSCRLCPKYYPKQKETRPRTTKGDDPRTNNSLNKERQGQTLSQCKKFTLPLTKEKTSNQIASPLIFPTQEPILASSQAAQTRTTGISHTRKSMSFESCPFLCSIYR